MSQPIEQSVITETYRRIRPFIRQTPVMDCSPGTFGVESPINLKLECLQHSGSFKARGAFNNLLKYKDSGMPVTAASGGNHGAAVAYVSKVLGLEATIFVPETSSRAKIDRIRSYGATVHVEGERYADAAHLCSAFQQKTGAIDVHPYDSVPTIAGQATVGREWEQQVENLDTLLIAIGGGGLISGVASWFNKDRKIIGVEPTGSAALHKALNAGRPVDIKVNSIAADSLGARSAGQLTFEIISNRVADVVLVDDQVILDAQTRLWNEAQIATEPGGAAALAALISGAYVPQSDERVGVLICGGNVDLSRLATTLGD
ncbi:MAG: threonine/serine dehydratase [Stappiaceae bacterium]